MALQAKDICVVCPTKARHRQLSALLASLGSQSAKVGQVIIADGAHDAEDVVACAGNGLNIKWLPCMEPGQIVQRNYALQFVDTDKQAILQVDDDIQFEPDAIANLVAFWNAQSPQPAGVSLNLKGIAAQKDTIFRRVFGMRIRPFGRVFASGYNAPITDVAADLSPQWLIGGATLWRRDILDRYRQSDISSRWAICEDLIFSYPVSKSEPLFVCASAVAHHVDDIPTATFAGGRFRGKNAVVWRYYFVTQHNELRAPLFFWMIFGQILGRAAAALFGSRWHAGLALGNLQGLIACIGAAISGKDVRGLLK